MPIGRKPNILFIVSDQHRSDCLGYAGNPDVKTPVLDKLSDDSHVFENCFCASPLCTPSRYSLLTGLHPRQHMGWTNHSTVPQGIESFPEKFRANGYRTEAVGKMHFTPTYLDLGFENMWLAEQHGPGRYDDDYHRFLRKHDLSDSEDLLDQVDEYRNRAGADYWQSFGAKPSSLPDWAHSTTWIADKALQRLDTWSADGQNLLAVSFIKPHHPFDPPAAWGDMYDPAELTLLPGYTSDCLSLDFANDNGRFSHKDLSEQQLRMVMAMYYGTISHMDQQIGRLLEKLRSNGLYDDTVVVYTSDHGELMGFHHMLFKSNYMYDPVMKVPLLIKPGGFRAPESGTRRAQLVSSVDIANTLLSVAGLSPLKFSDGLNILAGESRETVLAHYIDERSTFVSPENVTKLGWSADYPTHTDDYSRFYDEYMVRTPNKKLLLRSDNGFSQFFDLEHDPNELKNLIDDPSYQEEIGDLKYRLHNWVLFGCRTPVYRDEDQAIVRSPNALGPDEERREKMRAYFRAKEGLEERKP